MKTRVQNSKEIVLCQDKEDLSDKAARYFAKLVAETLKESDFCTVALSGGSTPKLLYERLLKPDLKNAIDWGRLKLFVSDERCVPHESNESNYGNAFRLLMQPLDVAESQLHPTLGQDKDPDGSALKYEAEINSQVHKNANGIPSFDIVFLGMGPDGHTASLFPNTKGLSEDNRLVINNHVAKLNSNRITFTFKLINAASNVIFMVAGEDKADVLAEVISGSGKYPCENVHPREGRLIWIVERSAGSKLPDHVH